MQGQDEADETRDALEACNAIGGAIEFTSVCIDAIKVILSVARCNKANTHSVKTHSIDACRPMIDCK